jgi:thiamine-phosphate pyrophosphorylase
LARAAARLGTGKLPPLVLMTDDDRLPDPLAAARELPRGSMVVARSRDAKRLDELSRCLLKLARRHGFAVLVAGDALLAIRLGADGFHLPEARMGEAALWRARFPEMTITTSAHALRAVMRAQFLPVAAVFLSPIFATASHKDRLALTPVRANLIARSFGKPIYALGGIDAHTARLLGDGFSGIAAVGALAPDQT